MHAATRFCLNRLPFFCSTECEKNWSKDRKLKLHDGFTEDSTADKTAETSSALFSSYEDAFDWDGMDLSVKPGDDFFHYATGKWIANAQIPEGHFCPSQEKIIHNLHICLIEDTP